MEPETITTRTPLTDLIAEARERDEHREYKLLENVAAIASSVFGDARIEAHIQTHDRPYHERLEWCIDAAKALTSKGPADPVSYDEANLDWIEVVDAVADGFFADADPAGAVESALKSPAPTDEREGIAAGV